MAEALRRNHSELTAAEFIEEMKKLNTNIVNDYLSYAPKHVYIDNLIYKMCLDLVVFCFINNITPYTMPLMDAVHLLKDAVGYYVKNLKFNFMHGA